MIKKGRQIIKSHMTMEFNFSGIRLQNNMLIPVNWNLQVDLVAQGKKEKTREEIEYNASITFQKINFWLETNLPDILLVNVKSEEDLYLANLTSNIMMYCPGYTSDDLLIQLLHCKISTLANPDLLVGEIYLKGNDSPLHYTFGCDDGLYMLPKTTADYYTESATRDKKPWWLRNDGFCFEFSRPSDIEISDEELFADIVDPLEEFHRIMAEIDDENMTLLKEPAKIVQVEKWKPKKV